MHILWINDGADFRGGAEQYMAGAVDELRRRSVRSTLLHGAGSRPGKEFTGRFDGVQPVTDLVSQVRDLSPDVIYVQQVPVPGAVRIIAGMDIPSARFIHDHEVFCLRRHKYTTIGRRTCSRPTGLHCYRCLGFLNRSDRFPGVKVRTLGEVRREQADHRALDAIVVGSAYMRDHVVAHGFDGSRVHRIPLFVDIPTGGDVPDRDPDLILFVGSLIRGKGWDILLRALREIPEPARLRVSGRGWQEGQFRDMTGGLGLGKRVEIAGFQDREALHRDYGRAACLVLPSRSPETFGLAGPEALLHATPVVASDAGGVGEWLRHEETGLAVPPGDHRALAAAIRRVLEDRALARRLGERGKALCEERFLPGHHADGLLSLFEGLT